MTLFRAELRKVTAGLLLSVLFALAMVAVTMSVMEQNWARTELRIASQVPTTADAIPCANVGGEDGSAECDENRRLQHKGDLQFLDDIHTAAALIGAQQTLPGAVSFVAGLMMTTPGIAAAFLLAAALVAGEWQRGTARTVFLAEQRLLRVLAAKAGVLFCLLVGLFAATSTIVYAVGATLGRSTYRLAAFTTDTTTSVSRAAGRVGICVLILVGFAVAAVGISAVMRHRVGAVIAGVVVIGLFNIGSSLDLIGDFTPFGVIVDLAGLNTDQGSWDALMAMPPPPLTFGGQKIIEFPLLPRVGATLLWTSGVGLVLGNWLRSKDLVEG